MLVYNGIWKYSLPVINKLIFSSNNNVVASLKIFKYLYNWEKICYFTYI